MNTCIIFGAAEFDGLIEPIGPGDWVIAADGGLRHVQRLGLEPDEIIGDFDSLGYVPEHGVVYPVEKDDTDTMLAVRRGLELGYGRFVLYGGMDGKRLDHTLANFQTLGFLAQQGAHGFLVGRDYVACAFCGCTLGFPKEATGDFSLFCLGPEARDVCIRGLFYEAEHISLTSFFPLGVSNHFTGREAAVSAAEGTLLALWERKNGLPGIAPPAWKG